MNLSLALILSTIVVTYAVPYPGLKFKEEVHVGPTEAVGSADSTSWKLEGGVMKGDIGIREQSDAADYYVFEEPVRGRDNGENFVYPSGPIMQSMVRQIISSLTVSNLQTYLHKFTSFNNRYYDSDTGKQASDWLFDTISNIIVAGPSNASATVERFQHIWKQSSIIARFPGSRNGPITVLGAHLDSVNWEDEENAPSARAPGADDDGSGSISALEAFRALAAAGFQPLNAVEFHWYSAEEIDEGLLGSAAVVASYKKSGIALKGMMQLDMTAYVKPGSQEIIGLVQDFTTSSLNGYTATLAAEYNNIPIKNAGECQFACSDHVSWNASGYPTTQPFEATVEDQNSLIHTSDDTTNAPGFSWTHMLEFSKLAIAFAVELGNASV
ncbi:hypothetical protein D9756_002749 [Leucocoprinus leucothites]|uniref:Peptide hydrolase n=1 Tax=Leucocoprinus leucothites TaxID=201217 RepID=A0A8H5GBX9_9AGAR|nr:hypothetical protein D9756_002749 [Leucoagaricus leucothites]